MNILTLLFILLFILGSCFCFYKKNFEYLFVALYAILPSYYAYEFSSNLPLLTASRIGIILLIIYFLINKSKYSLNINIDKKAIYLFFIYYVLRLISNFYYFFTLNTARNVICKLFAEEFLLILLLVLIFDSKEKIEKAFRYFTYTAGVIFFLAIIESIFNFHLFNYLYTVQRVLLNENYVRLGLSRAKASFGIPSFLATFCIITIPIIFYLYFKEKEKKYILILFLNLLALIHTGCRAQILYFFISMFIILIFCNKSQYKHYKKILFTSLFYVLFTVSIFSAFSPRLRYFYTNTAKSVLNEVGFDFEINEDNTIENASFGSNKDGTTSRLLQFSGISYTLSINPVFGLGAEAQNRGIIKYYYKNKWVSFRTYDVGYVAIISEEGIMGLIGWLSLFFSIIILLITSKDELNKMFGQIYILYLLCLLANNNMSQLFSLITGLFYAYHLSHSKPPEK